MMLMKLVRPFFDSQVNLDRRSLVVAILSPVLSISVYFLVFGLLLGKEIDPIRGIAYAKYILPGLLVLGIAMEAAGGTSLLTFEARMGCGSIEARLGRMPCITLIGRCVGGPISASILIALIFFLLSGALSDYWMVHPWHVLIFVVVTSVEFSCVGLLIGLFAGSLETVQLAMSFIVTPLIFFGGSFYSRDTLSDPARLLVRLDPASYLIDGLRWAMYGSAECNFAIYTLLLVGVPLASFAIMRRAMRSQRI